MAEDSDKEKPAFLSKERAESIPYHGADDVPQFDAELEALPPLETDLPPRGQGPTAGYETRWREIARLHALSYTNNQIAGHLGYSATGISLALKNPFVQAEITRWRERYYSQSATDIIKDVAVDAAKRIGQVVRDPRAKTSDVLSASTWAYEMVNGKAKQAMSLEAGGLAAYMEMQKSMLERGEPIDVGPAQPDTTVSGDNGATQTTGNDDWTTWIDKNVK